MNTAHANILIIDDDKELTAMLGEFLKPDQIDLIARHTGEDGLAELAQSSFDLLILDIMLPGMSGIDVLKRVRQNNDVPIVMLTARGDDVDRILGLEFGADDYLSKPFNPRELLARIKAILRRSRPTPDNRKRISVGSIRLDAAARSVTAGEQTVTLTGTEFELLRCLAETPSDVVSKDQLSQRALGRSNMPYDRSIDTHMSNLRRKLAEAGVSNPSIQSRRGIGYFLAVEA